MANKLTQRPAVQSFLVRLKSHKVMRSQILEAIRQASWDRPPTLADKNEVEELLLERQIYFRLDSDSSVLEEIGPGQAEQPMQWSGIAHCPSEWPFAWALSLYPERRFQVSLGVSAARPRVENRFLPLYRKTARVGQPETDQG